MNKASDPHRQLSPLSPVGAGLAVLGVGSDAEAVGMWLRARGSRSENTARTYSRCSDRLLLWCAEQRLTFSEMSAADAQAHLDALSSPLGLWLIPKNESGVQQKPSHASQTLKQPMSPKGVLFTRTVLGQLFNYLLMAGYVRRNVFLLTAIPAVTAEDPAGKVLSHAARKHLWDWVDGKLKATEQDGQLSKKLTAARERWVCSLLYYTGIRTSEAIQGMMADFMRGSEGWQLKVKGKGNKVRRVTVPTELARELLRFRERIGSPGWPSPKDEMPLIPHIRANHVGSISDRMLRKLISDLCKEAADNCPDLHVQAELSSASPHWFRHTAATHRQESGARLESTQQELGHASLNTTLRYAQLSERARREDAERFSALVANQNNPKQESLKHENP